MTKRRAANQLMFKDIQGLKYPVCVQAVLSGTGSGVANGTLVVVCASGAVMSAAGRVYLTISGTGTLVGTA